MSVWFENAPQFLGGVHSELRTILFKGTFPKSTRPHGLLTKFSERKIKHRTREQDLSSSHNSVPIGASFFASV